MNLTTRGNSIYVDFYYRGERVRGRLQGLRSTVKSHWKTADSIVLQMEADIARNDFKLSKYLPDHPKAKINLTSDDIKISDQLKIWLRQKSRVVAPSTFRGYESAIHFHLLPSFGEYYLSELKSTHVNSWIRKQVRSNKTTNNILTPLRAIFSDAYHDELIDKNPLERIKSLPVNFEKVDPFTEDELIRILNSCDGQIKNLFQFAFWTGLRTSEYIALKWENASLEHGTVFIHEVRTSEGDKSQTKTASGTRKISLLPKALEALENQQQYTSSGHIFLDPRTSTPWKSNHPVRKAAWKPALKRAGIDYKKPYTTRHTFASILLSDGVSPMIVAHLMGHKDWAMIRKVYGSYIKGNDLSLETFIEQQRSQNGHREQLSG